MRYRSLLSIFVIFLCVPPALSGAEPGFVKLFDGKSLRGWVAVDKSGPGYLAKDGILVCPVEGGGRLSTEKEYANFIFRFEFRLTPGANNGVGIRTPLEGDAAYVGMEIQILDDDSSEYKDKLRPAQYHGSVYDVVPARRGFLKKAGEWNQEEIRADGRRITVVLNGTVITDVNLDTIRDPAILKKHPGLARPGGHIGFLGHGTHVGFRHIRIKELP